MKSVINLPACSSSLRASYISPPLGNSLSHLSSLVSLCCTNPTPSSSYAFTSQTSSLRYISLSGSYRLLSVASPPPISQSNSQCLVLLQAGRRAGSSWGQSTGGTHCLQPPSAEVIFSSQSGSRTLHPCNPVSRPKDSKLTDYVD